MVQGKRWVHRATRPAAVSQREKQVIVTACEKFIQDVLKPRYLSEMRPTKWNYTADIRGAWAGGRYRFIQRFRSGWEQNRGEEFDSPFARLDCIGPDRFDIYWMRHTGKWWPLHANVTLAEALHILEADELLHPV